MQPYTRTRIEVNMSKREYIDEILSKKRRLPFAAGRRWNLVTERLSCIRRSLDLLAMLDSRSTESDELFDIFAQSTNEIVRVDSTDLPKVTTELSRYVPIGLVACLEGYFRVVYANLLDYGSPYRENATKLETRFTFNIETAFALQHHSVSLGEFVAHMLGTSSLDDINSIMSCLIGESFLALFKKERPVLRLQQTLFPVDEEAISDQIIANVKRLFELRHMYAHEIDPPLDSQDVGSIWRGADAAFEFLSTSENILSRLVGDRP